MFTIYDSFTGQIKRTSEVSDPAYGELALEGNFSADTHYVKKGEAIELPAKFANEPYFDYLLERWVDVVGVDPRTIVERRNRLLIESDWTQIPDVLLENKADWIVYRQKLRDITLQLGYPTNVIWPEPPTVAKPDFRPMLVEHPQPKEL